ncbi:hypothetical protein SAMN05421512_107228 [Stappia indica]|uniref:Uncharacterized protein n=2 Tax=Stappia indica TaxID=538381 RepID=A0A285SY92_9HYPH|nr:hypothetical protein SAMN05421512_107228 [Stappia indica]
MMPELITLDDFHQTTVAGAAVWDYTNTAKPTFFGATDSTGSFKPTTPVPKSLRIVARGYVPVDLVQGLRSSTRPKMIKLHPGTYSGFMPDAGMTTWKADNKPLLIQFTAAGLTRSGRDVRDLKASEYFQYKCVEDEQWAELKTRSNTFPTFGKEFTTPIYDLNMLRFPEPGIMLAHIANTGVEVRFTRCN